MNTDQFADSSPGSLVSTWAWEDVVRSGKIEKVQTPGLAFLPNLLPPELDWTGVCGRLFREASAAERALGQLNGKASRLDNPHILVQPFVRREARLSSQIEDTIATPEEVALAEAGDMGDRADPGEVMNYVRALEHGLRSELPLAGRLFNQMHSVLLAGVRGDHAKSGSYRDIQNYIGRKSEGFTHARFVPPPPAEVHGCMANLEKFMHSRTGTVSPLIDLALTHYQFEAIHPYEDGNGRLGRLLITLGLCRKNILDHPYVYVSAYFQKHEDEYKDLLLAASTHGAWEQWIKFFLDALSTQASDADLRVDRLLALWRQYADLVTGKRTSSLQRRLIDQLFRSPVVTIPFVSKLLGVGDTAARNHVKALIDLGILRPGVSRGKLQYYIANEVLNVAEQDLTENA